MTILLILVFFILILFPFGQLTRLPIPFSPSIRIYGHDVLIVVLSIYWLMQLARKKKGFGFPLLLKYIGLFILAGILSLVFNSVRFPFNELATGSLYLIRWGFYAMLYPTVFTLVTENPSYRKKLLHGLSLAGIATSLFGLIQYFLYPNLRNLMYLGWDPHEYRIFGTFFDSGFTGLIYALTLILLTVLIVMAREKRGKSTNLSHYDNIYYYSGWVGWALVYTALALTYSRSSYLAFLSAAGIFSLLNRSIKPFIISLILIIPLFFILPQPTPTAEGAKLTRTTSVEARLSNYEQSLEIIKDNPIFGTGFNMLRYENRNRHFVPDYEWEESNSAAGLDNSFLFILATTGIFGLASYGYLLFQIINLTIQQWNNETMEPGGVLILTTLAATATHSMFNNSLFYPWIMIWLWVLLGVVHASRRG